MCGSQFSEGRQTFIQQVIFSRDLRRGQAFFGRSCEVSNASYTKLAKPNEKKRPTNQSKGKQKYMYT